MNLLTNATIITGVIAALVALGTFMWSRRKDRETLRNALFAELRNIRQHYGYTIGELPTLSPELKLKKRLNWRACRRRARHNDDPEVRSEASTKTLPAGSHSTVLLISTILFAREEFMRRES